MKDVVMTVPIEGLTVGTLNKIRDLAISLNIPDDATFTYNYARSTLDPQPMPTTITFRFPLRQKFQDSSRLSKWAEAEFK